MGTPGSRTVRLTTFLHPAPRLRISGAVRLLFSYAFMACTGTDLPFYLLPSRMRTEIDGTAELVPKVVLWNVQSSNSVSRKIFQKYVQIMLR